MKRTHRHPGTSRAAISTVLALVLTAVGQAPPVSAEATIKQQAKQLKSGAQPLARITARVTTRNVRVGGTARLVGWVRSVPAGTRVSIQFRRKGRHWTRIRRVSTNARGKFHLRWTVRRAGAFDVRAKLIRKSSMTASARHWRTRADSAGRMFVYRVGHASWYGPGLYGNRTACGQRLTPSVVGVAHKQLPCGTKVRFRFNGHVVTARVIDRGPFIAGRDWDLTAGLKHKLRFPSTGAIWTTR